ncbi:MAG: 4-hydroxythreonine-4-phosphate dehydrogenase PdxA [Prevotellaceae bacterium]|jgi:4-hydroxythreonine-4-phosphate dehydrogenase|nr:4-hydroxythreonine-4-phosphate dehydrogenase PdxA [Prevotellaceae bacterium]
MKEKVRIGITHGDFNGINYEIIMKTFSETSMNDFVTPIIYGSTKAVAYYRKALNMEQFNVNQIIDAGDAHSRKINIINVSENVKVEMGVHSKLAGISSLEALDAAVADLQNSKIDLLVTCPVNKVNTSSETQAFAGHTEFLSEKFVAGNHTMLMINDLMRIGFVTGNIPFGKIAASISKEVVYKKIALINNSLKKDFLIRAPRIAVLALNPHNGDGGLLGNEEINFICPAIEDAKSNSILAFGTYAADGFFASGEFTNFDAVLAMHYDQGMIPFRSIGLSKGVNYTVGLPIVRTSPAHGTGYNIAGKGIAQPASLRDAIFLAVEIYSNRKTQEAAEANQLKIKVTHQHRALE